MRYGVIALTILGSLYAGSLLAEDGVPSQAKLTRLGLGSMQVASDQQGAEVRGTFFYRFSYYNQVSLGAITDSNVFQQGLPLTIGPSPILPIEHPSHLGLDVTIDVTPQGWPRIRSGESNLNFSITNVPFVIVPNVGLPSFILP